MKKVVFIRSTAVNPESRLEKEVDSLVKNGYSVHVLGWNRNLDSQKTEIKNGYKINRLNLKAPVGIRVILLWPIWWLWISIQLIKQDYDIIHAADFDSYFPAFFVAKIRHKPIIYDVYDFYPDLVALPKPIYKIFKKIDLSVMEKATQVIIVDKCRLKQINQDGNNNILIICNTPNDYPHGSNINTKNDTLKVFYGGTLYPERDIISMLKIASDVEGISVEIAGMGDSSFISEINQYCSNHDNTTFIGKLSYSQILEHTVNSDILFALYNPENRNNKYASPNKLFEAMMCKKPIIMNSGIASAEVVSEENMGVIIPYGDYDALKEAVLLLKNNPELRKELGENGRRAYENKYNWKIMEKRLLDLYASLENEQ